MARKVRELGVYADVHPSDTRVSQLSACRGIIISGGPSSVYDPAGPSIDSGLFSQPAPVLGICYGQQIFAHQLGGTVKPGSKGEYGAARLHLSAPSALFDAWQNGTQVWMSHRDTVEHPPPGFVVTASTSTCRIAALEDPSRRLYGVQFHPEVVHTTHGKQLISNFIFNICGCTKDWDPRHRIPLIEDQIRSTVAGRNVFFFVSGGVDSTVAFTLCLRALGPDRVRGVYVDTGLMREGETEFVHSMFGASVAIEDAAPQFLKHLLHTTEPEEKRHAIGEEFVLVQERIIETRHLLDGHWILGQGTIYPDTIESGGSQNAAVIKTHHNRVGGIQKLLAANRIVEPLSAFYKDEVREIGRELGLPPELLDRHPFPGPGLAIRLLCSPAAGHLTPLAGGWLVPILSVGVQGDSRSYAPILATGEAMPNASDLVNSTPGINRVIAQIATRAPLPTLKVFASRITAERLARLREADHIVRRLTAETGFDAHIWQFPVVLIPLGTPEAPDSVVLRPISSVDGMTAEAVEIPEPLLSRLAAELLALPGVAAVFRDLTNKPPATIEWE
ncbi:MAG: glutamine-hydrolyzing GMP synthase [Acidobacteriota bacterium]|nr:glutamine-hydrolyzing GMP synthase [Acidobacteriota bacterium]